MKHETRPEMDAVNLLKALPQVDREERLEAKSLLSDGEREVIRQYGYEYFDAPGLNYGGYYYDGRWEPVAEDIIAFYSLASGSRVLEIGCAKGYLVKALLTRSIDAYGLDVSAYAISKAHALSRPRLCIGDATALPFGHRMLDLVISIDVIHNLPRAGIKRALHEIGRVAERAFVQVSTYRTAEERSRLQIWGPAVKSFFTPSEWLDMFRAAGYRGHYWFRII